MHFNSYLSLIDGEYTDTQMHKHIDICTKVILKKPGGMRLVLKAA